MRATGADGCRAGWVACSWTGAGPLVRVYPEFAALVEATEGGVLAVDIPIGLLDAAEPGGRACDRAARAMLGRARAGSVFPPPVRAVLGAADFREALRRNRASSPAGLGLPIQCFNIVPKIREVDAVMQPGLQARVIEVHPEVCFAAMAGSGGLAEGKKTPAGRRRRLKLLELSGLSGARESVRRGLPKGVAPDDVIDAFAALWTALRHGRGASVALPVGGAGRDARGLEMAIRY